MSQKGTWRRSGYVTLVLATLLCGSWVAEQPLSSVGASAPSPRRPNIVFVLTDDLATNLVQYMPQVLRMQREGVTFSNYFVTDSLCCPSRASIFTGRFPHETGIFRNQGPDGGFVAFRDRGYEQATFATALSAAGYRTAMLGKYLNGYLPVRHAPRWDGRRGPWQGTAIPDSTTTSTRTSTS